jgi:hypothetical protein
MTSLQFYPLPLREREGKGEGVKGGAEADWGGDIGSPVTFLMKFTTI